MLFYIVIVYNCSLCDCVGKLILPVEPKSTLAKDIADMAARMSSEMARFYQDRKAESSESAAVTRQRGTPRKSLGSVAKKAPTQKRHKTQKQ